MSPENTSHPGPHPRTRIKYCGMTRLSDVEYADHLGVDAIGLVFYPPSPRAVTPSQAAPLAKAAGIFCSRVGLFVNPTEADVRETLSQVPLDVLQFHGDEPPEFCAGFDRPWIKALRVQDAQSLERALDRYQNADGLILDAFKAGVPGGTGEIFQWTLIPERWRRRIVLAGGLTPANVNEAVRAIRPQGVDVSGGIEAEKGLKSPDKMTEFMRQVTLADAGRDHR
ncbi:phosphoribosylanthranilate isomerase [Saccharospirillum impatiens]|uniref:phosphoribosylanthranilate isomerase n=1 Tax=Saccharospirillum impatiens TaxID=169438 RepID=UPI0003FFA113|nr:phosphoribosylanthranilate isomerase [Saccharospirillum impatiens]